MKLLKSNSFLKHGRWHMLNIVIIVPSPNSFPSSSRIDFKSIKHHSHRSRSTSRRLILSNKLLDQCKKRFTISLLQCLFKNMFSWIHTILPSSLSKTIKSFGIYLLYTLEIIFVPLLFENIFFEKC